MSYLLNPYVFGGWTFLSGTMYIMTSDSLPSPLTASAYNNGAYSISGSPYQACDNNNSTAYSGNYTNSGQYVGVNLNLGRSIRLTKLYYNLANAGGYSNSVNGYVDVYSNGTWINVYNSGGQGSGWNGSATLTIDYPMVTQIRARVQYNSGATAGTGRIYGLQVTEWYDMAGQLITNGVFNSTSNNASSNSVTSETTFSAYRATKVYGYTTGNTYGDGSTFTIYVQENGSWVLIHSSTQTGDYSVDVTIDKIITGIRYVWSGGAYVSRTTGGYIKDRYA